MCFPKSQEKATEKLRKGPVLLLCTRPPGLACPRPAAVGTPIPPQWAPPSPCSGRPHPLQWVPQELHPVWCFHVSGSSLSSQDALLGTRKHHHTGPLPSLSCSEIGQGSVQSLGAKSLDGKAGGGPQGVAGWSSQQGWGVGPGATEGQKGPIGCVLSLQGEAGPIGPKGYRGDEGPPGTEVSSPPCRYPRRD